MREVLLCIACGVGGGVGLVALAASSLGLGSLLIVAVLP